MTKTKTSRAEMFKRLPLKACVYCSIKFKRRNPGHKICDLCKQPHKCKCGRPNCSKLVCGPRRIYAQGHQPYSVGWHQSRRQKRAASKANKGRPKSAVQKKKQSVAMKGKMVGPKNPMYGKRHPEWLLRQMGLKHKGKIGPNRGKHLSAITRERIGEKAAARIVAGFIPWRRVLYRGKSGKIWMRSTWEVAVAHWLDTQKVIWVYEPFWFRTRFGFYIPDFFIKTWDCYIEVKGPKLKKQMDKLNEFVATCGKEVRIYYQADLQKLGIL